MMLSMHTLSVVVKQYHKYSGWCSLQMDLNDNVPFQRLQV